MKTFARPEHRIIAEALASMPTDFLLQNRCWFGGGTAIVLKLGEYRQSADVDFLCCDQDGYRELRQAAQRNGIAAFFGEKVTALRDIRTDQYGIRGVLQLHGQMIKFEIVREALIEIAGALDAELGVPVLDTTDMFAEKLLANADRCMDRSVAFRDAIDLGMLLSAHGPIPDRALEKVVAAYGDDIEKKLIWSAARLHLAEERLHAASTLQMSENAASHAAASLVQECSRLWPQSLALMLASQQSG